MRTKRFSAGPAGAQPAAADDTEARLLEAAAGIFAAEGFQSAKVRDICSRAGANIAAVNYHFHDKLGLYSGVLRHSLCSADNQWILQILTRPGPPEENLRFFLQNMFRNINGARPALHVRLMAHEMARPTPALHGVVKQVIRPRFQVLCELVGRILGEPAGARKTQLCALSLVAQVIYYAQSRAVIEKLCPGMTFSHESLEEIGEHVAAFSIAALRNLRKARTHGKRFSGRFNGAGRDSGRKRAHL